MLRITLLDGLEQVTLKLEGSLVGIWVKRDGSCLAIGKVGYSWASACRGSEGSEPR
jgi:hypothetical protein